MAYEFVLVREELVPREQVRLHYLLAGGRRHSVTITRREYNAETVAKIGRALARDTHVRFGARRGI